MPDRADADATGRASAGSTTRFTWHTKPSASPCSSWIAISTVAAMRTTRCPASAGIVAPTRSLGHILELR